MKDSAQRRVGRTHYKSADAFEQQRLDKYIRSSTGGGGGGASGGLPYPGSYGGSSGGGSFVVFDTDGTSSSGNLVSPLNSVLTTVGSPGSWVTWVLGSAPTLTFKQGGLYAAAYQAQIEGADAGVRLMCIVNLFASSPGAGIMLGGSAPNENDPTISYINMMTFFEMPNYVGFSLNVALSYLPYLVQKTASGSHQFDTVFSSLKIAKLA